MQLKDVLFQLKDLLFLTSFIEKGSLRENEYLFYKLLYEYVHVLLSKK